MKDFKIKIINNEIGKGIQKKLFKLGYKWAGNTTDVIDLRDDVRIRTQGNWLYQCPIKDDNYKDIPYISIEELFAMEKLFIEVKLNNKYTAKVFEDNIQVGCQTFPISIVKELNEAVNRLS